jgi:hypothetical protein
MDHRRNKCVEKAIQKIIHTDHNFEIQSHPDSTCRLTVKEWTAGRVKKICNVDRSTNLGRQDSTNEAGTRQQVAELPDCYVDGSRRWVTVHMFIL